MKKTILTVIIALIALGAVALAGFLYFSNGPSKDRGPELSASQQLSEGDLSRIPKQTETVNVLACGVDFSQKLTDVIMYIQYDPKTNSASILSIPRDTFVGDEIPTGKINQIYTQSGDMGDLVDEVRKRFLLDVDYYATITLEALGHIVDQLGGVEITIEKDLYDRGQLVFSAGTQTLNGEQAQMFVRERHAYANADLGRIDAQHQFLLAALHKVQSLGKLQMLQLLMDNFTAVQTDMPLTKVASVALTAFRIQEDDIQMFTVPGFGKMNHSYAVYEVDREGLASILNDHFLPEPVSAEELMFPQVTAPQQSYTWDENLEHAVVTQPEEEQESEPPEGPVELEEEPETSAGESAEEEDAKPRAKKRTDGGKRPKNHPDSQEDDSSGE